MMVTQHRRKTREVTGPTPHSVAIYARSTNKRAPEHLILERRKQDDQRAESEALAKYTQLFDLKNDWEKATDKRIQANMVKRKVDGLLQAKQFSLEDRRDRLRALLKHEEEMYLSEIADKEETVLERQAKMRAKAKSLKEKREAERQEFVQEKLDQQWRSQCEELRSTLSKRHQDEIAAERLEQMRIKDEEKLILQEEEKIYADLWYADIAAKAKREEEDERKRMEGNLETLAVLQKQMAALEAQKEEEKKLIEEEAQLLREQAELRKLEEQQLAEDKRRKQQETRQMYTDSLRLKKQKEAKEMQEQLAFDMKILEQLLEESRNEAKETAQRKKELREEDARYRAYLKRLKEEEALYEKELDRLCDLEVEKMWDKRIKQWRLEKAARKQLLADVMETRKTQLQEKLARNELARQEAAREKEVLLAQIAENKRLEEEAKEKRKRDGLLHQNDLLGQIDYNRRMAQKDLAEEERMFRSQQEAEREYRRKLDDALTNVRDDKMHPMRRRAINSAGGRAYPQ